MRATTFRAVLRVLPMLMASSLGSAQTAWAAPSKAAASDKARAQASLEEVAVMLSSADENEVRTALETAATLPANEVLPMLEDRVRAGLPRVLLDVAIDSLMLLDDRGSAQLLADLARHRRPEVRVRALELSGRIKAFDAEAVLTRGLGDPNADVRRAAADALGELGRRSSMPALQRGLSLSIDGSARALGRLARPDELHVLFEHVGQIPTAQLTPMFVVLLARRDVSEADKLTLIARVAALGGEEASNSLAEQLASLAPDSSPRVRRALDEAVQKGKSE